MPDIEAKTIAMFSSMQLKMSGLTTDEVTFEGSDLRTKKMRVKLMIVTLNIWCESVQGFRRTRVKIIREEQKERALVRTSLQRIAECSL